MNKVQYAFFFLLIIHFTQEAFFNHTNPIDYEINRHFNSLINATNELPMDIAEESNFPQTTTISSSKIEIDSSDSEIFLILLDLNEIIKPENIITEKGNHYIKIDINFNQTYYQIILKENELSIISQSNQKVKNSNSTKYAQSSSHMSRKERLERPIDLDSLKIKVNSQDKSIQIAAKYIQPHKNNSIDIEFK